MILPVARYNQRSEAFQFQFSFQLQFQFQLRFQLQFIFNFSINSSSSFRFTSVSISVQKINSSIGFQLQSSCSSPNLSTYGPTNQPTNLLTHRAICQTTLSNCLPTNLRSYKQSSPQLPDIYFKIQQFNVSKIWNSD